MINCTACWRKGWERWLRRGKAGERVGILREVGAERAERVPTWNGKPKQGVQFTGRLHRKLQPLEHESWQGISSRRGPLSQRLLIKKGVCTRGVLSLWSRLPKGWPNHDHNHFWVHLAGPHFSFSGYPQMTHQMPLPSTQWNTEKPQRFFIWCAIKCCFGVASDAKLCWKIMVVVVCGTSLTSISCYRTSGPWNWSLCPGKPNASSTSTPSWKGFEGFLKAFWRGFWRVFPLRRVRRPFKTRSETRSETPSGTLQKPYRNPGGSVAGN